MPRAEEDVIVQIRPTVAGPVNDVVGFEVPHSGAAGPLAAAITCHQSTALHFGDEPLRASEVQDVPISAFDEQLHACGTRHLRRSRGTDRSNQWDVRLPRLVRWGRKRSRGNVVRSNGRSVEVILGALQCRHDPRAVISGQRRTDLD
ncbi:MAG: hypothetical protein ABI137_14885, partial [Antricoccus sp.]